MWISKLLLLSWKNWIIVKRHPIVVVFELVFPIVVVLLSSAVRNLLEKERIEATPSQEFDINPPICGYQILPITKLVFAPENDYYSNLMKNVVKNFDMDLIVFEDGTKLNNWVRNQTGAVAAVVFDEDSSYPPKHLKYTIRMPDDISLSTRWETDKLYYYGLSKQPRSNSLHHEDSLYYSTCFLKLQNEIDQAFIETISNGTKVEKLKTLKSFPYPAVEVDVFVNFAAYWFPILFVLSMIFSAKVLIKNITIERESRLTESMKIMGLSSALYWSSWFMRSFIILLISFTINLILTVTSIISEVPMFANSNPFIIWIFFMSYITSMITFCFLVSVVFKKLSRAVIVGSIVFIATAIPYIMYHDSFYRFGYGLKVLFCMLTNTNMSQGIKMILMAEANDGGVGFGNLFKRSLDLKFSFGELLLLMNIGSVLQILLANYIEKVFPGEFGLSKPWYFPLKFVYRRILMSQINDSSSQVLEMETLCQSSDQEKVPAELLVRIELKNLSKRFGTNHAVRNLSLNLYENQITVLLGHNGAGKTTAMSMLTGLYQPKSGTAIINGYDIRTNIDEARKLLGVCPQHDVLFDELTVAEHLEFYCKLKKMKGSMNIQESIVKFANQLGLSNELRSQSKKLSGGQKRKLSVAIALCGESKFVILDEPTSGMDPASRRLLWDLLIAEKKNRTILITTHFMDEADVLGDRIAIMSEGQLRTVGSSFFLKKRFGTGYRLTCVKQEWFNTQSVLSKIRQDVPDVRIESDADTEAVFRIPEEYLPKFDTIFKSLEDNSERLRILSFGCSFTSLEDVFLKLAHVDSDTKDNNDGDVKIAMEEPQFSILPKSNKFFRFFQQILAMFLKKFYVLRRSWTMFAVLGIISVLVVFMVPKIIDITPNEASELEISLNSYEETETLVQIQLNFSISEQYIKLFNNDHKVTTISSDIEEIISSKSNKSLGTVNYKNLIAATFKTDGIIAWYNTQPFHCMPLTVNAVNRAILKSLAGTDYDITITNQPYEMSDSVMEFLLIFVDSLKDLVLNLITFMFLLIIWPVIYIGFYIKERQLKFKFQQFISGTNRLVYWFTNLIFDYILFILICSVLFGCMVCLNYDKEQRSEEFGVLLIVGSFYGFSWICFIYAFSYFFSKPSAGETMLLFVSIILCIASAIDYALQSGFTNPFFKFLAGIYHWIGMMFAPFTLVKMSQVVTFGSRPIKYLELEKYISMNIISGCIFFLIIVLNDYNFFAYLQYKRAKLIETQSTDLENLEEDVQNENQAINQMSDNDIKASNLVLKNVVKNYNDITAVRELSLNVNKHECFGLLGINGAGKTTTFKMMTGDELITSGDIWIKGKCLKTQLLDAHQFIGYCPQFDNCIPELTGRETLKIFALIRGIKMDEISELINQMSSELDFKQHLDKQVRAYSGGNRRKLSTALALLGNPELIFLDECTTGVDPHARRQIWNAIKRIRDNHRLSSSIVITSHSMDECEALCTRIGIMVAGQFQCLGSVQHLKNKFSKGLVLTIKTGFTDESKVRKVREVVVRKFLNVGLKEQYLDILTFHLTAVDLKYSEIFILLAEVKEELRIDDYALTQMSLEQVFLNISKQKDTKIDSKIAEEESVWRSHEIADRKRKEEERLERERIRKEKERLEQEGNARKAREEAERIKKEERKAKEETDRKAKEEEDRKRIKREKEEALQKSKEAAEQKKKEEAIRKEKEKAAQKAKEEAARKEKKKAKREKNEAKQKEKEEADLKKREAEEKKKEADRKKKEELEQKKIEDNIRKEKEKADHKVQEVKRKEKEEKEAQTKKEDADRKAQKEAETTLNKKRN